MSGIDEKLAAQLEALEKPSIFKIHDQLRSENEGPYEPQVVSIGPYHHGKPKLKEMEKHKLRYFKELRGDQSAERYIGALTGDLQDQARSCYAEKINLSDEAFVEMLCVDGCFVIEFLRKKRNPELLLQNDPIFRTPWLLAATENDLILFENQLPFCVLLRLFDLDPVAPLCPLRMTQLPQEEPQEENLIDLAIHFSPFSDLSDPGPNSYSPIFAQYDALHLLDIVYKAISFAQNITAQSRIGIPEDDRFSVYYMTSASELQEISGVKFEGSGNGSWLEITWENGAVKIPPFTVHDNTESLLRNLIAYENHYVLHHGDSRNYINDYAIFMGRLINSVRDVEVLRHSKIIINKLNDDQAASTIFRRVTGDIYAGDNFCYAGVCSEVEKYAERRRHIWWTKLRRTYFNTPWSPISFVAAVVALILTFLQTFYTIRPVGKN